MNRLIIVGNGFDIAHDLKTKYSDFIADYWEKVNDSEYKDEFISFGSPLFVFSNCKSLKSIVEYYKSHNIKLSKRNYSPNYLDISNNSVINVHNEFFCRINERYDDANWVDIEMEYYYCLKRILNRDVKETEDVFESESLKRVNKLNNEISGIAKAFEKYLLTNVVPNIPKRYNMQIHNLFENNEVTESDLTKFFREFPKRFIDKSLSNYYQTFRARNAPIKKFERTYILNFNYTNTVAQYLSVEEYKIINIHGELGNTKNPINLGFGDERDKFYSEIEDHNQNEYLRFMKSFYYSKNNNYKMLFDFVEDLDFQVQIMGHSCGLSDRTLLNAIFEHRNCQSIKVFYHHYSEASENGEIDNHSEVVKNISRHFTQKTNMRDKIVNHDHCEKLPQREI